MCSAAKALSAISAQIGVGTVNTGICLIAREIAVGASGQKIQSLLERLELRFTANGIEHPVNL